MTKSRPAASATGNDSPAPPDGQPAASASGPAAVGAARSGGGGSGSEVNGGATAVAARSTARDAAAARPTDGGADAAPPRRCRKAQPLPACMSSASRDVCVGCDRPLPTGADGVTSVATLRSAAGGAGLCRRCAAALLDGVGESGGAGSLDSVLWRLGLVMTEDDADPPGPGPSRAGHPPAAKGSGGEASRSAGVAPSDSAAGGSEGPGEAAGSGDGRGGVPVAGSTDGASAARPRSLISQRIRRAERATDQTVGAVMNDLVRKVEARNKPARPPRPPQPLQPSPPASIKVQVIVPENACAGSRLTVQLSGAAFDFVVPEGWVAGETRRVGIPAAAYAAAQARVAQEEAWRRHDAKEAEKRQRRADEAQRRDFADVQWVVERLFREVVRAAEREAAEAVRQRQAEARRAEMAARWHAKRAEVEARRAEAEARRVASEVGAVLGRIINVLVKPEKQAAARAAKQAAKNAARVAGRPTRPFQIDPSGQIPNRMPSRPQLAFAHAVPFSPHGRPPPAFAPPSGFGPPHGLPHASFAPPAGFVVVPPGNATMYGGAYHAHQHLPARSLPHPQLAGHAPPPPASYLSALAPRGPPHPQLIAPPALPRLASMPHNPHLPYSQPWQGALSHPAGEAHLKPQCSAGCAPHDAWPQPALPADPGDRLISWESLPHEPSVAGAAAVPPRSHESQPLASDGEAELGASLAPAPPPLRLGGLPPRRAAAARAGAARACMTSRDHGGRGAGKKTPRYPRVVLKFKGKQ
jgi:hypothetical protein